MKVLLSTIIAACLLSCATKDRSAAEANTSASIRYAKGFSVRRDGDVTYVTVNYPYQGATSGFEYLLVPGGMDAPDHGPDTQVITVPLNNIVCTATTHIPHLDYLGLTDKLIGFPSTDYICSEKMRARVDNGSVRELGVDKGMNLEVLYSLHPSLVMSYMLSAEPGQMSKIRELGIPVVINAEYLESDPLGRAEWIKFTALFFDLSGRADSIFSIIEESYLSTKKIAASATSPRRSVMSGIVYGDTWFMPGGGNYAATLLRDAGCNYLWENNPSTGFLELSFETVFQTAKDADIWIGVGSFNTLQELTAAEKRYALFRPYKQGQVYSYNARMGAKGGNDFLELGYLRPDFILKDLVKIAQPELLPGHTLFFHKQLE